MVQYCRTHIRFPDDKDGELREEMNRLATTPWLPQQHDPHGRPTPSNRLYFHRDTVGDEPSCSVCIRVDEPGHWIVGSVVPDAGQVPRIPPDQYNRIVASFESDIVTPAARAVGGTASTEWSDTRMDRLEDHFSPEAVGLLQCFCETSNRSDLGSHPFDQEKWIGFLLRAYDDKRNVHCDTFGTCLKAAEWWPEKDVPRLVEEYDFAMRLLKQARR